MAINELIEKQLIEKTNALEESPGVSLFNQLDPQIDIGLNREIEDLKKKNVSLNLKLGELKECIQKTNEILEKWKP